MRGRVRVAEYAEHAALLVETIGVEVEIGVGRLGGVSCGTVGVYDSPRTCPRRAAGRVTAQPPAVRRLRAARLSSVRLRGRRSVGAGFGWRVARVGPASLACRGRGRRVRMPAQVASDDLGHSLDRRAAMAMIWSTAWHGSLARHPVRLLLNTTRRSKNDQGAQQAARRAEQEAQRAVERADLASRG